MAGALCSLSGLGHTSLQLRSPMLAFTTENFFFPGE